MVKNLRRCICCRDYFDKVKLIRVVKNGNGEFFVDETKKADGRGAYCCNDCLEKAIKTRGFNRSLHANVPSEIYEALETILKEM